MKTVDIVQNLLEYSADHEWITDENKFIVCPECRCSKAEEHKPDCKFIETTEAAREYLKIMEGSKK